MRTITDPTAFRKNVVDRILYPVVSDHTKSHNLEVSIYNFSIDEAGRQRTIRKWDNPYFVQLDVDKLRAIVYNLQTFPSLLDGVRT